MHSTSPHRQRRHVRALALTVALSLSPAFLPASVVVAETSSAVDLAAGDSGDAVRSVQQALIARGFAVAGGADGSFGSSTESALRAFQQSAGVVVTGTVNTPTAVALGLVSSRFFSLGPGSEGRAVMDLQQQLSLAGVFVEGDTLGVYGDGTRSAVETMQRQAGLSPTGTIDASTAVALENLSYRPVRTTESAPPAPSAPQTSADDDNEDDDAPAGASSDTVAEDGITDGAAADDGALRKPIDPNADTLDDDQLAEIDAGELVGLEIGSTGAAVQRLQLLLIHHGFSVVGGADGIYGVLTANSVRSFQYANGLAESGEVDASTANALVSGLNEADGDDDDNDGATGSNSLEGLRFGSVGADVRALQEALIAIGISIGGGADGRFGSVTLAAVKQFQERSGLSATGVVDAATAEALAIALREAPYAHLLGLQAGAVGNTVKELQQRLIDLGVTVRGGADGIFGPATAAALEEFQASQGIAETGRVDEATVSALAAPVSPQGLSGGDDDDDGDHDHDDDSGHDHDHGDEDEDDGWPSYGERGDRVRALQSALIEAGIPLTGGVDGVFGGGTSAAVMEFQRRNDLPVTGRVDDATATALGLSTAPPPEPVEVGSVTIDVFPMQGPCSFTDTWGAPRSGGRSHQGTDIIGATGLELYAAADGTITKIYENYALAGNGVRITMDDGTYFFYAHMSAVADGLEVGSVVEAGDVVGYNGATGNAGTPHLHFEVHPGGGAAINPYPLLVPIDGC